MTHEGFENEDIKPEENPKPTQEELNAPLKAKLKDENLEDFGNKICKNCGSCFNKKLFFVIHEEACLAGDPLTCPRCHKGYASGHALFDHFEKNHLNPKNKTCNLCWEVFDSKAYRLHKDICSVPELQKYFECKPCQKKFKSHLDHRSHCQEEHNEEVKYICDHCDHNFVTMQRLSKHIYTLKNKKSCTKCGKEKYVDWKLEIHSKICLGDGKVDLKCPMCQKEMKTEFSLIEHVGIKHYKLKEVQCQDCGKAFPQPRALKLHRCRMRRYRKMRETRVKNAKIKAEAQIKAEIEGFESIQENYQNEGYEQPDLNEGDFEMSMHGAEYFVNYTCEQCFQNFDTEELLNSHRIEDHGQVTQAEEELSTGQSSS